MFFQKYFLLLPLFSVDLVLGICNGIFAAQQRRRQSVGIALIDNLFDVNYPPFCTGVLLTHLFVLTSDYCWIAKETVITFNTEPLTFGELYYVSNWRTVGASKLQNFRLRILKLDRSVPFTQAVQPFSLPINMDDPNEDVDLYGFGATMLKIPSGMDPNNVNPRFQREISRDLNFITMPKQPLTTCNKIAGQPVKTDIKLMCYGFTEQDKYDYRLMLDDQGAPLIGEQTRIIYGIAIPLYYNGTSADWNNKPVVSYVLDVRDAADRIRLRMQEMLRL